MPRVAVEHVEISREAQRVSITGTVDDSPAATSFRLTSRKMTIEDLRAMSTEDRRTFLATELARGKREQLPVPGKQYVDVPEE